jgi:hypothetical protein
MFHAYVVSIYVDVVYVCNVFQAFLGVFFANISEACFKCFIYLQKYIASVAFGCFKSRSGIAHVAMHLPAAAAKGA